MNQHIIIKCNSQICEYVCYELYRNDYKSMTIHDLYHTEIYKAKDHNTSGKFHYNLACFMKKMDVRREREKKFTEKLKLEIEDLKQRVIPYCKNSRVKLVSNYDYDAEKKDIPKDEKSNCWYNRIQYQLLSEFDCYLYTGFDRSTIIKQAEICETLPELIFHLRHWMYRYEPHELHAARFGWSTHKLKTWMFGYTLPLMHKKYAKSVLVSDKTNQYYSRDIIHDNCPNFVYRLRHIDPTLDINVITVDSTYQFCQAVQTNFDIRKHTTNMHKHTTLVKIHIWCCANGQPIYAQYIFGDGYHADGKVFAAAMNKDHLKLCEYGLNYMINIVNGV